MTARLRGVAPNNRVQLTALRAAADAAGSADERGGYARCGSSDTAP